jgi:histidinol phosphatase-like PHP family hydrolase
MAKLAGAKMVVDTDSHSPRDLITSERAIEIAMGAGLTLQEASAIVNQHAIIRRG